MSAYVEHDGVQFAWTSMLAGCHSDNALNVDTSHGCDMMAIMTMITMMTMMTTMTPMHVLSMMTMMPAMTYVKYKGCAGEHA